MDLNSKPVPTFQIKMNIKKEGDVNGGDHLKESGEIVGKDSLSERVKIPSYNNIFKKRAKYQEKPYQSVKKEKEENISDEVEEKIHENMREKKKKKKKEMRIGS